MAQRRSKSRARGGRHVWTSETLQTQERIVQNGASLLTLLSDIDKDVKASSVVLRIIGALHCNTVVDDVATRLAWGIAMLSLDAFTAGAVPDMFIDDPAWLLLDSTIEQHDAGGGTRWRRYPFDVKGRRKFRSQDQVLVLNVENTSDTNVDMDYMFHSRTLLWIP